MNFFLLWQEQISVSRNIQADNFSKTFSRYLCFGRLWNVSLHSSCLNRPFHSAVSLITILLLPSEDRHGTARQGSLDRTEGSLQELNVKTDD